MIAIRKVRRIPAQTVRAMLLEIAYRMHATKIVRRDTRRRPTCP
jgi:hypothetical protein